MTPTLLYKGYRLATTTTPDGESMYQARVAIVTLSQDRPRSQRFVDFELYRDRDEADARAIAGGKEWVDAQISIMRSAYPSRFAPLS